MSEFLSNGAGSPLATIFQNISHNVQQIVSTNNPAGSPDRYVTGGVNWNGYDLGSLIGMVANQASPAQVEAVAGLWSQHGAAVGQSAADLQRSLGTLLQYWQGAASTQATNSVTSNTNWLASLGNTATQMATPIQDAAGALRSAQSTMPGSPGGSFFSGFGGAAGGAAIGMMVGGPFGAAAGAVIGGLASMFGFGSNKDKLKQQAVQTMQRYEQAGMNIDPSTPQFTAPSAGLGDSGAAGSSGVGAAPGVGTLPGSNTIPSMAVDPAGRWNSLIGAGGAGGGFGTAGGGGFGGVHAPGGMFGSSVPAGGVLTGARFGAGGAAGASEAADGAVGEEGAAGGGRGVLDPVDRPGGPGAYGGAGGRGARREDDKDHRRHLPFEEDPFATGMKAVPPVIGLSRTDRGDADQ